jgi:hypothetical protein
MLNSLLNYLNEIYYQMLQVGNRLTPQQWVMALVVGLGVGILCMRGFGSRSNY